MYHGANIVKRRACDFVRNPSVDSPPVLSLSDEESTGGEQVVGDERGRAFQNGSCIGSTGARATRAVRRRSRGRRVLASDIMVSSCKRHLGDCSRQSASRKNIKILSGASFFDAVFTVAQRTDAVVRLARSRDHASASAREPCSSVPHNPRSGPRTVTQSISQC